MTIEHLVTCNGCGMSTEAVACHDAEDVFHAPDDWIDLGTDGDIFHFCSWVCAGAFVTRKMRVEDGIAATQES